MANELQLQFGFSFNKPGVSPGTIGPVTASQSITVNGTDFVFSAMTAPITTPAVVDMAGITTPHWSYWINNDSTNYVTIQNGLTGAVLIRLLPGEQTPLPLDPTAVPYVLANEAPVSISYLILPE